MNFLLTLIFLVFSACLFLVIINQNFTFRIVKRKLKWWILAHWGSSILALLGKFFLLTIGPLQVFKGLKFGESFAENLKIVQNRTFFFPLPWKEYKLEFSWFIIYYLIAILVYTHLAYLHMYLGYTLEDKIRKKLIQLSLHYYINLPYLEVQTMKNKLRNILSLDIPLLSLYFAGGNKSQNFNQIFFQGADALITLNLTIVSLQNKKGVWIISGAAIFTLFLVVFLQWLIIKRERKFRQSLDKESQKIDDLLSNIELLKKKELSNVFLEKVNEVLKENTRKRIRDKFLIVANGVYPNQLLPRAIEIILFFFTLNIEASGLAGSTLKQLKSVLTATWDLPSVLVSNNNFANFYRMTKISSLKKKSNICISEPIEEIELRNIYFRYQNQKNYLLENFNKVFVAGEVTKLEGKNGTGKSTVILLILGLIKPQKGEIVINRQYKLGEIDLENWRKQISYVSNKALLKEGSEGEKQNQELEDVINKKNYSLIYDKEKRRDKIIILDEPWGSIDLEKREWWKNKILTDQKNKIIIVVEH